MKVTIDLDALLAAGEITRSEYDKLSRLGARGTTALAFNILTAFGVIAVAGAGLALVPAPETAIVLGCLTGALGIVLILSRRPQWGLLANICVTVGALLFAGGVILAADGARGAFLTVALTCAAASILARSAPLIVIAVLALASMLGTKTGYLHAAYFLGVEAPTLTIVVFTILGLAGYQLAKRLSADDAGLAIAAARTSVFLVNFGFWIGSLWGDSLGGGDGQAPIAIPDWAFASAWALALVGAGVWAWRVGRRWMLNTVAVFAAIHFYTQWFERLGASAGTVLIAGLLALGAALLLRRLNALLGPED